MKAGIVTPKTSIASDNAVTRNYDRDTIPFVGQAHCTGASWIAHGLCHITGTSVSDRRGSAAVAPRLCAGKMSPQAGPAGLRSV